MIRIPPIHGQETAFLFQFCTETFESDFNIYVFICNECCNRIITQSGKIELIASREREGLPKRVVTNVLAQVWVCRNLRPRKLRPEI